MALNNRGEFGNPHGAAGYKGFEWPRDSGSDFLFSAGIWIGAIVNGIPRVSTATDRDNGTCEFWPEHIGTFPSTYPEADWFASSWNTTFFRGRPYACGMLGRDDDGDGRTDEDPPGDMSNDHIDNDRDGFVDMADADYDGDQNPGIPDDDNDSLADEDAAAWGNQEYYSVYQDSISSGYVYHSDPGGHTPLHVMVLQRSYSWSDIIAQNIIILDFIIRNTGTMPLDDVYVAFFADPDIRATGTPADPESLDDKNYFDRSRFMMVQYDNPNDADGWGPGVFAVRLLGTSVPLSSLRVSFAHGERMGGGDVLPNDVSKYARMSSGIISPPSAYFQDWDMLLAFGDSVEHGFQLEPGEELPITLALIAAADTVDLHEQADYALYIWEHPWEWQTVAPRNAYPELIQSGPTEWGYRLHHVSGEVGRLVFTNFCSGTTGRISGSAVNTWIALPNGDGNNGDSIIFISNVPLISGTIDTFWLSHPYCAAQVVWLAGDSSGEVDGPLPVELLSFTAIAIENAIRLSFSTASETDNDHFEILRGERVEGEFTRIVTLPSQGNSATEQRYEFTDTDVNPGQTYWYILADVDMSGHRTEHRGMTASATALDPVASPLEYSLAVYPNPFNPSTTISFSLLESGRVRVAVYDVSGRWIKTLTNEERSAGNHRIAFDARDLPSGVYFVRMESGEFQATSKVVLMR